MREGDGILRGIIGAAVLGGLLATASAPAPAVDLDSLPDIGDSAGAVVSPREERAIGEAVLRAFRGYGVVLEDPELEVYIESVGYRLVAQSDAPTVDFNFFVVRDPAINAFATPGGFVGVHTGLLLASRSESELAAVLAHEVSHVTQRHGARAMEAASKLSIPTMAAMVGALLLGALNPEAGQAAVAAVSAGGQQFAIDFTRSNEYEADRVGINLLHRAGFDPYSMAAFFERLQQTTRYSDPQNYPVYLRTHPVTVDRIAESRSRAEQLDYRPQADSLAYHFARAKARVLTEPDPRRAVRDFEQQLRTGQYPREDAARYGYALALTAANEFGRARAQLDQLLAEDGEQVAYLLAAARLESAERNYDAAVQAYDAVLRLYPYYRPAMLGQAEALLSGGRAEEARTLLRSYAGHHATTPSYFKLLADAEGRGGSTVESHIALAEYYFASGESELAMEQLKIARHDPTVDRFQSQRIEARLSEIEAFAKDEKERKG